MFGETRPFVLPLLAIASLPSEAGAVFRCVRSLDSSGCDDRGMTFIVSACSPEHWVIMAALITASATLSLAVGYPKKARAHADLAKAFMALEAQMVGQGVLDMTQAARFEAEILRIEMNE